jgi:4-aminobutyrate aminotransferase-like enzyme
MGGGLPMGAVVGKALVMDAAEPGTIGGTYGGNPVACAASLATISVMESERLCERATRIGDKVMSRFKALEQRFSVVGDVRGRGAMVAIEFSHDRDPFRPASELCQKISADCRAHGVLVLTSGPHGNILRVLSPLVITDAELEEGLRVIDQAVEKHAQSTVCHV